MMRYSSIAWAALLAACAAEVPEGASNESASADLVAEEGSDTTTTASADAATLPAEDRSRLSLFLTDAPADYEHVWVTIEKVEVDLDGSWRQITDEVLHVDLLELQGGLLAALGDAWIEPGHVGQIRFLVQDAEVTVDGVEHPLKIPSGTETGIKIPLNEDLVAGAGYQIVLDFDALKSVKKTGHGYLMQPVIVVQEFEMVTSPSELEGLGGAASAEVDTEDDADVSTDDIDAADHDASAEHQGGAPGN